MDKENNFKPVDASHFVQEWRLHRGWSPRELAKNANLTDAAIHHIETGRSQPTLPTLIAIAVAMGITPGALLDVDPTKQRQSTELRMPQAFLDKLQKLPPELREEVDILQQVTQDMMAVFLTRYADERLKRAKLKRRKRR